MKFDSLKYIIQEIEHAETLNASRENSDLYLMRPLSPSLSISHLEKSNFSFGGSFEIEKLMNEIKNFNDDPILADQNFDLNDPHQIYLHKVKEIEKQIENIKDLYAKEEQNHELERRFFEKTVEKIKNQIKRPKDFFSVLEEKHSEQLNTIKNLISEVRKLQQIFL